MNGIDIFILIVLLALAVMAVVYMRKKKEIGGCGCCPCRGNCPLAKKSEQENRQIQER